MPSETNTGWRRIRDPERKNRWLVRRNPQMSAKKQSWRAHLLKALPEVSRWNVWSQRSQRVFYFSIAECEFDAEVEVSSWKKRRERGHLWENWGSERWRRWIKMIKGDIQRFVEETMFSSIRENTTRCAVHLNGKDIYDRKHLWQEITH